MQRISLYLILFFGFLSHTVVIGQLDVGLDPGRQKAYLQSVRQYGEFVDRFNQDSYEVPGLDAEKSLILDRRQSILMLFYPHDPRFDTHSQHYSEAYVKQAIRFAEDVVDAKAYLNKHSDQISAVAATRINVNGQPDTLWIVLNQKVEEPNLVRWVISDVEGSLLEIPERDTTQLRFISPVSHELGFMDLKKALNEPSLAINYVGEDFEYDALSVFLHGIILGSIEVNDIISVHLEIPVLDRYVLKVGEREIGESVIGLTVFDLKQFD